MSDSCFDNLGWTIMATQIEQVWKCHNLGHLMSIIWFISHRASRPQRFFPVSFNPGDSVTIWKKYCRLFHVFFTRIHNVRTTVYHRLKINKFDIEKQQLCKMSTTLGCRKFKQENGRTGMLSTQWRLVLCQKASRDPFWTWLTVTTS